MIDKYLSELEAISVEIDKVAKLQSKLEFARTLGVTEEIYQRIRDLMPIAKQFLIESDLKNGRANYARIELVRQADISLEEKIILGAIWYAATEISREKSFIRYFEPYSNKHPIFIGTELSDKLRDNELISLEGCRIINDHIFLNGSYFSLSYYNEAMVKYLKEIKNKYRVFVRVDPYVVYKQAPLKVVKEAVIRPIDPHWIEKLNIYPGNMTAGEYILEDSIARLSGNKISKREQLEYYEYNVLHIKKLEVYAARGNNKNLHMMIEELRGEAEFGKYFVGKCIHLDTDEAVGTKYENAVLNHIDLAINVYDNNAFDKRKIQSLSHGKVVDATMRTHIMRVENVPFKHLPQIAADFLDSKILYCDWMNDMFEGKNAGEACIYD